jgi:hypothetical protein
MKEGAVGMGDVRHFPDIGDLHHGVRWGFDVDGLHRFIEGFFHFVFVGGIYEFELNAVLFVYEAEETDGAAVEVVGRKDGVPRFEEFHHHGKGGHAGGIAGTVTAVFKGGHYLFCAFSGRILNPGIVIACGFAQLRMAESGALENGYGNAAGGILPVAAVNADCFDIHMKNLPIFGNKKSSLAIERRCITVLPLFFSPPSPEEDLTGTPDNAINTLLL